MTVRILNCDVMDGLGQLSDESVHCVVTSVPYYALRDYGMAGQIGLEPTLGDYLDKMVEVFREVRRVLRKDGTCWLNIGDSYAGSWGAQSRGNETGEGKSTLTGKSMLSARQIAAAPNRTLTGSKTKTPGLKPKDLMMVPARLAIALQDDGWWLRQDIIWSKPNPMPESVTDRCTKAHEHVFLLSKSEHYSFDAGAIKEPAAYGQIGTGVGWGTASEKSPHDDRQGRGRQVRDSAPRGSFNGKTEAMAATGQNAFRAVTDMRNKRSVWTIATRPFGESHFATMPEELAETCVKAGCPVGGTVLDPFGGAGTTAVVADRLGRDAILIELNSDYAAMAERRIARDRLERGTGDMADVERADLPETPLEALIRTASV